MTTRYWLRLSVYAGFLSLVMPLGSSAQSVVVTNPDGTQRMVPLAPTPPAPVAAAPAPVPPSPPPVAPLPQGTLGSVAVGGPLGVGGGPPPLVIAGDGQRQTIDCAGQDVEIQGSNTHNTLHGGCRSLRIIGSNNVVDAALEPGTRISMQGNDNQVAFVLTAPGPNPLVSIAGNNDRAWHVQQLGDAPGSGVEVTQAGIAVHGGPGARVTEMRSVPELMQQLGAVQTPQGTLVQLSNDVLFNFDSDAIRPNAALKLMQLSQLIDQLHPPGLRIVGNTDNIGSDTYNMNLSLRRAQSVEKWLETNGGVRVASTDIKGEGFHDPIAPNQNPDGSDNPAGRQRNRRVDVLIER